MRLELTQEDLERILTKWARDKHWESGQDWRVQWQGSQESPSCVVWSEPPEPSGEEFEEPVEEKWRTTTAS